MAKYQCWKMDNLNILDEHIITATPDAIKEEDILKFFEFTVRRYKDTGTQQEQIEVSASLQGQPSGTITTNLINMEKDMPKLRAYGIALGRQKYVELCQLISAHYYYFNPISTGAIDNVVTAPITNNIFDMFCQYIKDHDPEIKAVQVKTDELYNIPLKDFNAELGDSVFRAYNPTEIKKALLDLGYTVVNKGKFDYVVSVDGTKVKMVSFKKDKVDARIKNLEDG